MRIKWKRMKRKIKHNKEKKRREGKKEVKKKNEGKKKEKRVLSVSADYCNNVGTQHIFIYLFH